MRRGPSGDPSYLSLYPSKLEENLMTKFRGWIAMSGVALLGIVFLGCGDEKPPAQDGDPSKLSPGMENMKNEMLKNFKSKSLGKTPSTPSKK
jgi:hypothetical protein